METLSQWTSIYFMTLNICINCHIRSVCVYTKKRGCLAYTVSAALRQILNMQHQALLSGNWKRYPGLVGQHSDRLTFAYWFLFRPYLGHKFCKRSIVVYLGSWRGKMRTGICSFSVLGIGIYMSFLTGNGISRYFVNGNGQGIS